jgi:hypothetical protein
MVAAAVWLAGRGAMVGWGAASDGKAVNRQWKSDLTDDPALIPHKLAGAKNSVIVPTGRLVIIDIDKHGWYEKLVDAGLPPTFTVQSPTIRRIETGEPLGDGDSKDVFQGRHLYVAAPDEYDVLSIPGVWQGGETRRSEAGEQSMVLGPWAMRIDGVYEVLPDVPRLIAAVPASVLDFIRDHPAVKPGPTKGQGDDGDWVWDPATMGSRHDYLRDRIRFWRGAGLTGDVLRAQVSSHIEKHRIPLERPGGASLDAAEIERMCIGAERKYDEDPAAFAGPTIILRPKGKQKEQEQESESSSSEAGDTPDEEEEIVIDPLRIEMRAEHPEPLELYDVMPPLLFALVDHTTPIIDAPISSLTLVACCALGALFGPAPKLNWNGTNTTQIFGVLVGLSNWGRKSGSMTVMEEALAQCDPLLPTIRRHGIASGEALIDILGRAANATPPESTYFSEEEFVNVLIAAQRENATYSGNLRKAWDGRRVETHSISRGTKAAEGYHVGVCGAITPNELEKRLTSDDISNGWANRFLWFWTERRPGGKDSTATNVVPDATRKAVTAVINHARSLTPPTLMGIPLVGSPTMHLSPDAKVFLDDVVEKLDVPPIGAIGVLQQRMPKHALRLAMIAALLDLSTVVEVRHLRFGFRMTGYAVMSMNSVFGTRVEDPLARLILGILAQAGETGLNTTQIRVSTGGKDYSRIRGALESLESENLIVGTFERPEAGSKGGRPGFVYRLRRVSGA